MAPKKQKSKRDTVSDGVDTLIKLLMWEVSSGMIPLPKGMENYKPPAIPFTDRSRFIDAVNKKMLVDLKINPETEESGFELLKGELNERKRDRESSRSGGIQSPTEDSTASDDLHARGNAPSTDEDPLA